MSRALFTLFSLKFGPSEPQLAVCLLGFFSVFLLIQVVYCHPTVYEFPSARSGRGRGTQNGCECKAGNSAVLFSYN